jgi:UDP-glucose 4-epimerase
MRVLVTGGAGFIGSHVASLLLAAGHEVAVVDDFSTGHAANVPAGAHLYRCDICDDRLEAVFADFHPEVVSHHAAQMSVRVSIQQPRHDAAVNVGGSVHLLECAVKAGTRKIIYASTGGAVYGEPRYLPCDETHPIAPLCHYGISKHTVEHYLELYSHLYGLDFTALRYPNVFGPRQDPEGEAGVVAIFARRMLRDLPVTIYGDGLQERDFVSVTDVARATLAALDAGSRSIINLGSGTGTSVKAIFAQLARIIGYAQPSVHRPARLGEINRIFLSGDRARDLLNWAPTVTLEAGLLQTVDWVRSQLAAEQGQPVEMAATD